MIANRGFQEVSKSKKRGMEIVQETLLADRQLDVGCQRRTTKRDRTWVCIPLVWSSAAW